MNSMAPNPSVEADLERRESFTKYARKLKTTWMSRTSSRDATPRLAGLDEGTGTKDPTSTTTEQAPATGPLEPTSLPEAIAPFTAMGAPTLSQADLEEQERAQALFARFGLPFEQHDWSASNLTDDANRVQKPIRMRVHRSCHHCETMFGSNKVCATCEHVRCKKCPHHPVTEVEDSLAGSKKVGEQDRGSRGDSGMEGSARRRYRRAGEPLIVDSRGKEREKSRTHKPVKQRIRRTCHRCQVPFVPATSTTCESCAHVRCTKCPRDPAKKKRHPDGYPGDAPAGDSDSDSEVSPSLGERRMFKRPRLRVRWACEGCETLFVEGIRECVKCNHQRCDGCTRRPPKRQSYSSDPDILGSVEAQLAQFGMEGDPPSSS